MGENLLSGEWLIGLEIKIKRVQQPSYTQITKKQRETKTHILDFPFLLRSYKCVTAFVLALLQLYCPSCSVQTQLLLNVVPDLVTCGVLKILQQKKRKKVVSQYLFLFFLPKRLMPHFLTDLVPSKSMTRIQNQWLPTIIVLSSIQT